MSSSPQIFSNKIFGAPRVCPLDIDLDLDLGLDLDLDLDTDQFNKTLYCGQTHIPVARSVDLVVDLDVDIDLDLVIDLDLDLVM